MEKVEQIAFANMFNVLSCRKITLGLFKNPLTAKIAKDLHKVRKELIINVLTLRALRLLSVLCG